MKSAEEIKELRSKNNKSLLIELDKSYSELRNLRFKVKLRDLKNIEKIKKTKCKISRILTILRENLEKELKSSKGEK